ncbi:unnamed protein product [Mytilus edulis]|uniref:Peptidase A2 domain-containing protein n=1 Tax=Mytilus edulis TaxID=6550 RepID=A0A8S3UV42_MYTED|nr:unnamed protein product [Mytilus edulis]
MLVDTGATITILRSDILSHLPNYVTEHLEKVNTNLLMEPGESTPFLGKCKVEFHLYDEPFQHEVWFADILNEGILGFDFLAKYRCDISVKDYNLTMDNTTKIPLFASCMDKSCCRIVIGETTTVNPYTKVILTGIPSNVLSRSESMMIEPSERFTEKNHMLLARLLKNDRKHIPLRRLDASQINL